MPREIEPLAYWSPAFAGLDGVRWTTTRPQTTHNAPFAGLGAYVTQPKMEALYNAYLDWTTNVFDKYDRPSLGTEARPAWDKVNAILIGAGDWAASEGMDPGAPGYDLWSAKLDEAKVLFSRIQGLLLPAREPSQPVPARKGDEVAIYGRVGPWPAAIGLAVFALAIAASRGR